MGHQLFLVGFAVLISPGSMLQLLLAMLLAFATLVLRLLTQPFTQISNNFAAVSSSLSLVSVLLTCVFLRMRTLIDQARPTSRDRMPAEGEEGVEDEPRGRS